MSNETPESQAQQEKHVYETVLREALRQDLEQFLDVDVHISGYIVGWICRNCPLDDLERLVDEMDDVFTVGGRSILTGLKRKM
jgi:hypothetical protein